MSATHRPVTANEVLASNWPLSLGITPWSEGEDEPEPFYGSCPCCVILGDKFRVEVSCWRTTGGPIKVVVSGQISSAIKFEIARHIAGNCGWASDRWEITIKD